MRRAKKTTIKTPAKKAVLISKTKKVSVRKTTLERNCKLQDLIESNVIKAGVKVLKVERHGKTFYGDLKKDGTIDYSAVNKPSISKSFPTPSNFSNFCCRKADSTFKYGNGFTYTQYSGDAGKTWKPLDHYRKLKSC